jgi:hypothetical protein
MTPQEFIDYLIPLTKNDTALQSLLISQICLESGFGKHIFHNNCLGIKCHAGVECKDAKTQEYINGSYASYKLAFAVYPDIASCILDYLSILSRARYKPVREAKNYVEATDQIRLCGYASSPTYTENLRKIIIKYKLYELDWKMNPNDKLTPNFIWKEFWQGNIEPPEKYFDNIMQCALQLQKVRDLIKKPIIITSAYRTNVYNAKIGGAKYSKHLTASAVDSHAKGLDIRIYLTYLVRYTDFNGFCIGSGVSPQNLIHADLRTKFWVATY